MIDSVTYELSVDDMVSLSDDQMRRSKALRRQARGAIVGTTAVVVLGIGTAFTLALQRLGVFHIVFIAVFTTIFLFLLWRATLHSRRNSVRKLFAEGKNLLMIGPHRVDLHEGYLTSSSPVAQSHFRWDVVEAIERTDAHVFIYVSSLAAIVIPLAAFASPDEADAFNAQARRCLDGNRTSQTDLSAPPPWASCDADPPAD